MVNDKEKIKRTKAFRFILPMLSWKSKTSTIDDFLDETTKIHRSLGNNPTIPLLNCYIGDSDKSQYTNNIFLLYNFIGTKEFAKFEHDLEKHPQFVEMYCPNGKLDMFVFNVPEEFQLEYNLFKSERPKIYRRFSDDYKKQILRFLDPLVDTEQIREILYYLEKRFIEEEKLIGAEIPRDLDNFSIPIVEEETFNIKTFKNGN